jgi:hypothetical protein
MLRCAQHDNCDGRANGDSTGEVGGSKAGGHFALLREKGLGTPTPGVLQKEAAIR